MASLAELRRYEERLAKEQAQSSSNVPSQGMGDFRLAESKLAKQTTAAKKTTTTKTATTTSKPKSSTITTTSAKPASTTSTTPTYTKQAEQNQAQSAAELARMKEEYEAQRAEELARIEEYLLNMRDAYIAQQKGILEANLESQLTALKNSLDQAVADGELSVREAEYQFEQQKQALEKQAYLDSERTQLYGQEMGLQNSQQMAGLIAGDTMRANSLLNQNMTVRDKQIADIRTRLDAIKNQYNNAVNEAQANFNTGLMQVEGQAQQQYAQNMFNLKQEDYSANRQQQFNEINMAQQFLNALQQATHESNLMIDRMNVQHGLDLEKINVQFQNDLKKMGIQHEYALKEAAAAAAASARAAEAAFQRQMKLIDPSTPEGKLMAQKAEADLKNQIKAAQIEAASNAYVKSVTQSAPNSAPTKPIDYTSVDPGASGHFLNWLTGYNKNMKTYEQEKAMWDAYQRILNTGKEYSAF